MMKNIHVSFLLTIITFLVACNTTNTKDNKSKTVQLSLMDSNSKVVNNKDSFTIDLNASVGQGFSWQLADSSFEKNVHYLGQTFENQPGGKDGSDGIQHFKFQAIEKGQTTLNFIYVQPFNKPYPKDSKTKQFPITIK
ncbi:MAG: hypothetical protein DI598_07655 [Pseudopedobacter saltans]|uniref:Proteinase inhibitor I42 chagasin domain-containing protein n=1 Tax=Pseudopedobacter saltans TaxID=151895 RepID=A0A2W5GUH5_9SPHI|nr:MAG: hypothetical protein DI598_07655 [Pseudopedobacter saltans]